LGNGEFLRTRESAWVKICTSRAPGPAKALN